MVVRVTRMLEYEYPTAEDALADMERWHVPPSGTVRFGPNKVVRSAVVGPVPSPITDDFRVVPASGVVDSGAHALVR